MRCGHISNGDSGAASYVGRAEVRTRTDTSALKLKVRTDEGDTVEISLAARTEQSSARGSWRGAQGTARVSEQSSSSSLTAQVKVDGNLSDQEVADIQHLLESLGSGGQAENPADNSLAAYDYSYTRTREVTRSTLAVMA
jgi:hypothetical protein